MYSKHQAMNMIRQAYDLRLHVEHLERLGDAKGAAKFTSYAEMLDRKANKILGR